MARDGGRPVIIKRIVDEGHHGHHGGAWKVAYADFVTAMMAFFLMLWLLSTSSEDTLKGLAEYFTDASANEGTPGGVGGMLNGISVLPAKPIFDQPSSSFAAAQRALPAMELDTEPLESEELQPARHAEVETEADGPQARLGQQEETRFEIAKEAIIEAIEHSPELGAFADSIVVEETAEGLRIQLLDRENMAMFPTGSDRMEAHTERLLRIVTRAILPLPNRVSIRGHTDSRPFANGSYDNWRLSSDRANATRLAMLAAGLPSGRIAEVVGKADAEHLFPADPNDARNRRMSIVLLRDVPVSAARRTDG
ncbi:MAG TPA: flagellar motor protein MotB [Geminicoccaceae bacterium]|nr:flagellar motor protein MotB [Geminicoccus sp.]HMU48803.1 flagellar motor protein MotB [Geminicoccaceae bacterium]